MNESFIQMGSIAMPRNEETNQHIREAQRAKILDAAREVFARKGLAATMADVAAAAGVSQGLAYRYFANKDELINILVKEGIQSSIELSSALEELPTTPGQRLTTLITRLVDARREHPEFFQLFYHMANEEALSEDIRTMIEQRGRVFFEMVKQLIIEGQVAGEIAQGDPDQLVITIMAYMEGLTMLAVTDTERFKKHAPGADIILRIFKPGSER
jgi:AcrR family transcriptional regulator